MYFANIMIKICWE